MSLSRSHLSLQAEIGNRSSDQKIKVKVLPSNKFHANGKSHQATGNSLAKLFTGKIRATWHVHWDLFSSCLGLGKSIFRCEL